MDGGDETGKTEGNEGVSGEIISLIIFLLFCWTVVGGEMLDHLLKSGQGRATDGIRRGDRELVGALGAGGSFRAHSQEVESTTGAHWATEVAEGTAQHCFEVRKGRRGLGAEQAGQANRGVFGLGLVEDLGKLLAKLRVVVLWHSLG